MRIERWQVPGGPAIGVRRWDAAGSDPARCLVLLHGLSASSAHYTPLAPGLAAAGWQVISLDFRGHGLSDRVPGTYVIEHYAADVEAFLVALGAPAVLAGHSLGGATAVYLAGARPDLVRAAFAEDPPLYHGQPGVIAASPYPSVFRAARDSMRRLQDAGADEAEVVAMLARMPGPGGKPWVDTVAPATVDAKVESFLQCDPSVWDPAIEGVALAGWDPERPVGVALTILRADPAMGPALTAEEAGRFRRANPDCRIVEVVGAPHGIRENLATTSSYLAELMAFLAAVR